ncbi:MAG: LLM class flavin-dependent oxidoreductase [Oxalicibacterium faecigallinarum]|uniref:LLM class flavin-dependent oxidoreductase n=1 Tax=Oxalicibacterium faecigallinarum TaxID=573741 RepID=UPI0028093021|nr:LLM class flavin-dependent oxidoreductase [Oxalicibacterium faecigallinarum]MDQ7969590.1 LLM class flavin-dependent oxidoreductase [Oxalicibacterium faecigallinarum]
MSSQRKRQLHFNVVIRGSGHHAGAWRHPQAQPKRDLDFDYYKNLAQEAERGLFDAVFMADGFFGLSRRFEPFTLLSALSSVTSHIGLIGTADTTYNEPFHLARKFASLDHISRGRAAWNLVTGANSAVQHFTRKEHPERSLRYEIATEFVDVVKRLWDSWEEDFALLDLDASDQLAHSRPRTFTHQGKFFSINGPLNVPRPPQGHPVIVQAGQSDGGKELAARTADVVFTAQQTLAAAQDFYKDVKSRMARYGRQSDQLLIMPGFAPIVGDTEAEAKEIAAELNELVVRPQALANLSRFFTVNLADYHLDDPVPLDKVKHHDPTLQGITSIKSAILDAAERERMTIRQFLDRSAGGHGFVTVVGSVTQVADVLQQWLEERGADGFNLMPSVFPVGLTRFVDSVIPELQNRGIYRQSYEPGTLRDRLGLAYPERRDELASPQTQYQ